MNIRIKIVKSNKNDHDLNSVIGYSGTAIRIDTGTNGKKIYITEVFYKGKIKTFWLYEENLIFL